MGHGSMKNYFMKFWKKILVIGFGLIVAVTLIFNSMLIARRHMRKVLSIWMNCRGRLLHPSKSSLATTGICSICFTGIFWTRPAIIGRPWAAIFRKRKRILDLIPYAWWMRTQCITTGNNPFRCYQAKKLLQNCLRTGSQLSSTTCFLQKAV